MNQLIKTVLFVIQNSPWKLLNEAKMLVLKPYAVLYLQLIKGVQILDGFKMYGLPKVFRHNGSSITIGRRFESRNNWDSNPLGIDHPTIICTWRKGAEIIIGNDVGISGGSIVAAQKIEIGDGTLIGANTTIIDTDFHPVESSRRRYDKKAIKTKPVSIGKNVFIGMHCIILKGVTIPDNAIVPAGSVVRKWST